MINILNWGVLKSDMNNNKDDDGQRYLKIKLEKRTWNLIEWTFDMNETQIMQQNNSMLSFNNNDEKISR